EVRASRKLPAVGEHPEIETGDARDRDSASEGLTPPCDDKPECHADGEKRQGNRFVHSRERAIAHAANSKRANEHKAGDTPNSRRPAQDNRWLHGSFPVIHGVGSSFATAFIHALPRI